MSNKETGGAAFPLKEVTPYDNQGMSLRDYFAAKAMQGILSGDWNGRISQMANEAYQIADAMMEARK